MLGRRRCFETKTTLPGGGAIMKIEKSFIALVLALVMGASLCLWEPSPVAAADRILLGISQDITGVMAPEGRSQSDGYILAVEEWNKKGGINGQKIEYMFRNHGGDPVRASGSCKIFVDEKVCAAYGGSYSTACIAEMKVLAPAQIPMLGGAAALANFQTGPDGKVYYFAGVGADWSLGRAGLAWAAWAKHKKIAILNLNVAWPRDLRDVQLEWIKKEYGPKYGIECIKTIEADVKATDLTPQAAEIKALNPDAVICNIYTGATSALARAFASLDYYPPWANYFSAAEALILTGDPKLYYNHVGYAYASGIREDTVAKRKQFVERFGYEPNSQWVVGYDSANLTLMAIKDVGCNPIAIRDWLATKAYGIPMLAGKKGKTCQYKEEATTWLGKTGTWYSHFEGTDYAFVRVDKEGKLHYFDIN
jgi:branched-chain amino acid transport system substrate-binding protein